MKYIVIHCTATNKAATVQAIQNYWKNTLKWKSPGYHKLIDIFGTVHQLGKDEAICNGVAGYNSEALHVSYIGGIDTKTGKGLDTRTPEQNQALFEVVKAWKQLYPDAEVLGHRDFPKVAKECPCFDVRAWWETLKCNV